MADEDEIEIEETEEVVGEDLEIDDLTEVVDPDFDPDADAVDGEDFDPDALTGDLVVDLTNDGATALSDEGSTLTPVDPTKPKSADDDDDEDDLRTEDDVEADLSSILQDKLASDDRTDGVERLQPRRPDETQCSHCFLLVRQTAPGCPVEDDACPLFVH
ncbi:MAG: hypothetical protein EBT42_01740 [Actinobacteria bacterium]|nr:hypothetical protein [Actinomycetota bacterium]